MKNSTPPVALITGASRGIGRAIARDLQHDHRLILGCVTEESAASLREEFPHATLFQADLTHIPALAGQVDAQLRKTSVLPPDAPLDVLIHSAGITGHASIGEATPELWESVLRVNVQAVAELTRLLLPNLRSAGGVWVGLNSGAGQFSGAGFGPYAASKHALKALADALREEERGRVRVCSVHPGKVDSDMQREIQHVRGNPDYQPQIYVRPESIAKAVRLCLDTTAEAMVESITVRPVVA